MPASITLTPCVPPSWAKGGHAQTLLGHFLPSPKLRSPLQTEWLEFPDGDKIALDFIPGNHPEVVTLFHGLGGDNQSDYVQRMASICQQSGRTVILANHRGCGIGKGKAKRPYHSGCSDDLASVIRWGRNRFKNSHHLAIGYSLSGNALLLLLGTGKSEDLPDMAVSVNAPIDLEHASYALGRGFNRVYDIRYVRMCQAAINSRVKAGLIEKMKIPWNASLRDMDALYTAPASGFRDREDYYLRASAKPHLKNIQIPTVVIMSEDDPFVPVEDYQNARFSPSIHFHLEKVGGHLGYLTRNRTQWGNFRWLDYALSEFASALFRS